VDQPPTCWADAGVAVMETAQRNGTAEKIIPRKKLIFISSILAY
jgi:hypothetical protein